MAGGRHIMDHKSWIGAGKDGVVYPTGAKHKQEHGAEGFGTLAKYEDDNEEIVRQQNMAKTKVHGHPRKDLHRN